MTAPLSEPAAMPGPDPGACPICGEWRKAGIAHSCEPAATIREALVIAESYAISEAESKSHQKQIEAEVRGWFAALDSLLAALEAAEQRANELERQDENGETYWAHSRTMWRERALVAGGQVRQLRDALERARTDVAAVAQAGFDSTRQDIAIAAMYRIDQALAGGENTE